MQISRNIVNGLKSNVIRFWWESGLSSAYRNYLDTFCLLGMFKIEFRDSLHYPKHSRAYARGLGLGLTTLWAWDFTKTTRAKEI